LFSHISPYQSRYALSIVYDKIVLKVELQDDFICGFSQLMALEFFVFRKMEMPETENHLFRGWCSKCL
uniref:hypothetical protein n=1 Tax=Enterocloster clostridioformis TaxID=1531 RepID=UPI002675BC5F